MAENNNENARNNLQPRKSSADVHDVLCDDVVSNRTFVLCLGEPLCSHHL